MSKSVNLNANKKKAVIISHLVMGSKVKNYILVKKKEAKVKYSQVQHELCIHDRHCANDPNHYN